MTRGRCEGAGPWTLVAVVAWLVAVVAVTLALAVAWVVLVLPTSPDLIAVYFGAVLAGGVPAMLSGSTTEGATDGIKTCRRPSCRDEGEF